MKPVIYICTHKDFISLVKNENYKIIDSRKIHVNLPLKDDFYSELYQFKWVRDNVDIPSYIGFCHYRRYFSFGDEIPSIDGDKCLVTTPMVFNGTVREHYGFYHNIEDLNIVERIINEKYPEYVEAMNRFLNGNIFIPCNMFIMSGERFKEYCDFAFDVMDEYLKIVGTDIMNRIEENKEKYIKNFHPNDTAYYQYRIGGYMMERLTNIFIFKNFNELITYGMVVTEGKY